MEISADKIQYFVIIFLRLTIIIAIAGAIWNGRWALLFSSILVLILTFLPLFFQKKYKMNLPLEFESVIILFIYASLFLGEINSYYLKFWWWDVFLHISSGIALGFVGFLTLYVLYYNGKIKAKPIWIAMFAFCFGIAVGSVWEIFEFAMDQIFGFNMQKSGLMDTMGDLIVNSLGSLFSSFIGYFYIKGKKTPLFNRFLQRFTKNNPKYFKNKFI